MPAPVGRDDVEPGRGEEVEQRAPGLAAAQAAVQQHERRAVPAALVVDGQTGDLEDRHGVRPRWP